MTMPIDCQKRLNSYLNFEDLQQQFNERFRDLSHLSPEGGRGQRVLTNVKLFFLLLKASLRDTQGGYL